MNMKNTKDELRMPSDEFDGIMRRALQATPRQPKVPKPKAHPKSGKKAAKR
jgi:hypothetical protein